MLGFICRQHNVDGLGARKHALRGSLSRGPWNKCGQENQDLSILFFPTVN